MSYIDQGSGSVVKCKAWIQMVTWSRLTVGNVLTQKYPNMTETVQRKSCKQNSQM